MAKRRKGRPSKSGKRHDCGKLKAPVDPRYVAPSDWVSGQVHRFGQDYNSALGRAFASGLLGEGSQAKDRYDTARKLIALYGAVIGKDRYRCGLDQSPRGVDHMRVPTQRDIDDQEWLLVNLTRIDNSGCRPFFDQLTSARFTDYGPPWLDRLLATQHRDRRDTMILDAAIKGIDAIGPVNGARVVSRHAA